MAVLQCGVLSLCYRFRLVPPIEMGQFVKVWQCKKKTINYFAPSSCNKVITKTSLALNKSWSSTRTKLSPFSTCSLHALFLQVPSCMSAERVIYVQNAKLLPNNLGQLHVLGAGIRVWWVNKNFWLKHLHFTLYFRFMLPSQAPPFLHPFKDRKCANCSSLYVSGIAPI